MANLPDIDRFWRLDKLPHIWCPGCGNGIVLQGVLRGIHQLGLDQDKVVVVSGIGCSSRSAGYVDFNTLHTLHGRALPFATGVKAARPDLTVLVLTGDGDLAAIGGNHFIHAARRNIDLTVVVFNNSTYGMTSGQSSPLTPVGSKTATAPHGHREPPMDLCRLAEAAGATYVARTTTFHVRQLPDLLVRAVGNKGFSLVEVVTGCPVYFGRMNRMSDPPEMLRWQRQNAVNPKQYSIMSPEERKGKIVIGELYAAPAPEFTEEYAKLVEMVRPK